MTDYVAPTIGLLGAAVCLIVLWRGHGAGRRAADAQIDHATGLLDRRRFDRDVDACAAAGTRPCAVLLVDIDPHRGDRERTRQAVAAVLASLVRAGDVAYRYTGERFAVLLPATDAAVAGRVAERIRATVASAAIAPDARDAPVTVSVGVAAGSAQRVHSTVSQAVDAASSAGPNRVSVA